MPRINSTEFNIKPEAAKERRTTLSGTQRDIKTKNYYFIIFADNDPSRREFESEPVYEDDEEAHEAAVLWVRQNKI